MPRKPLPPMHARSVNLTPLIDVVFQLIIFFMLVGEFNRQHSIQLDLPRVDERRGAASSPNELTVHVLPGWQVAPMGGRYRVDDRAFEQSASGVAGLTEHLRRARERSPELALTIRASREERYEVVDPALGAAASAGITTVRLATLPISARSASAGAPSSGPTDSAVTP